MTAYAESVRGAVPVESLGFVLSHEHVFLRSPGFAENYPRTFPREEVVTIASRDLRGYREKGVSTIVDMTTVDLGRDVSILAEVSRASGVNIIAATGSYTGIPTFFQPRSAERIAELFIADLTEGVAGTAIKAGVIKCSMDEPEMTVQHQKLIESAVIAHKASGAPISTHSSAVNRTGLMQAKAIEALGANMQKVIIGHSGDTTDLDYLYELLETGCTLGLDRFGLEEFLPTAERCRVVAALCDGGFGNRIVLSHDSFCFNDSVSRRFRDEHLASWRMDFLVDDVLPTLRQQGVLPSDIELMTIVNPARVFGLERQAG